jgi:hypothetical protein
VSPRLGGGVTVDRRCVLVAPAHPRSPAPTRRTGTKGGCPCGRC